MRSAPKRAAQKTHDWRISGAPREQSAKGAPRVPFALLITGLISGGLAALLGLNTMAAANELRRHDLAGKDVSVAAELQQLQDDVAASGAPGNLARAAEALGMVPAGNPAFLVIGPDGRVRILGSAAPATAPPLPVPPKPKPKPTATSTKTSGKPKPSSTKTSPKPATRTAPHGTSTTASPTPSPTPTVTLPGGTR
jgi:hypothetical protein